MQAGGGLVQDVDRVASGHARKFLGQFDALGFAARECGSALSQLDIPQTDVDQGLEPTLDLGDVAKVLQRLIHVHVQDIGNVLALVANLEGFAVEAGALAQVAAHPNVGQKVHLYLFLTVPLAGLATPTFDIEAKPSRLVAACLGFWYLGKDVADVGVDADIGGWVGARCAANGSLGDVDRLVDLVQPGNAIVVAGLPGCVVQCLGERRVKGLGHERRFPAARNAGHAGEQPQRESHFKVLEIVLPCSSQSQPLSVGWSPTAVGRSHLELARQIFPG